MFKKLLPYIIIIIVVVLIRTFIASPIRVTGDSMDPTIKNKEIMLLYKLRKYYDEYERFDIVVFKYEDSYLIKRIIGLPGDTVSVVDGELLIDGKPVKDEYANGVTNDFEGVTVKADEYFLMGDNRVVSKDSRYLGPISKDEILGYANIVLFPFNKIRSVE